MQAFEAKLKEVIDSSFFSNSMYICVLGYALFKVASRYTSDIFQTFLILGSLIVLVIYRKKFSHEKTFWLFAATLLIQFISWINSLYQIPSLAMSSPNLSVLDDLFMFIFIAFWLKGSQRKTIFFLFSFIIGVILSLYLRSEGDFLNHLIRGVNGQRVDFHITNAQHTSLISGAACLYLITYLSFNWYNSKVYSKSYFLLNLAILFLFLFLIVVITQSRQVWLALFLAISTLPLTLYLYRKSRSNLFKTSCFYLLIPMFLIIFSQTSIIKNRLNAEHEIINSELFESRKNIPISSIGLRIHFLAESLPWIQRNTLLGTGEETRILVIQQSTVLPEGIREEFKHLHNSNAETLVSYGIIGFVILYILFFYPVIKNCQLRESQNLDLFKVLGIAFLIYWLIVNNFESYFYMTSGQWVFNVFFGAIYTFYLTDKISGKENN